MKFGSLFSGIGGFDLGFERAGLSCAWQCEIDEKASAVLAQHWPDVRRYQDVRHIGAGNLEPVDLICGGFPCQDLSVAGKRAGLAGERSGLWFEFHRILSQSHPEWVVIENVPGLLSSNGGRDFAVILRGLVQLGYGVAWRILDAQYFGVAQRRRRVFIVGSLGDGRATEVLFEREGGSGDTAPSREAGQRPAPTIAGGFSGAGGGNRYGMNHETAEALQVTTTFNGYTGDADDNDAQGRHLVVGSLTAHHGRNNPDGQPFVTHTLRAEGHDASEDGTGRGVPMVALQMNFIRKERISDYAGSLAAQPGDAQFNGVWDKQNGVRRLMPVECERLQGFPDGWTDGQADSARYRQLGNAVAVPCAEWLGWQLAALPAPVTEGAA